jgi:hypothetical protein
MHDETDADISQFTLDGGDPRFQPLRCFAALRSSAFWRRRSSRCDGVNIARRGQSWLPIDRLKDQDAASVQATGRAAAICGVSAPRLVASPSARGHRKQQQGDLLPEKRPSLI